MSVSEDADTLAGRSILVIEDEFYLAMEVQDEIRRAGGAVLGPCVDAAGGLALLAERMADAAIVDINLGSGPSFEVADALRAAGVPFLFLTGYDSSAIPERFADVATVQKPVGRFALLNALRRLLAV